MKRLIAYFTWAKLRESIGVYRPDVDSALGDEGGDIDQWLKNNGVVN